MPRRIHTFPTGGFGNVIGIPQILKVTSPAAGANWSFTLPGGYYYRVLSGTATLVTSAAVANRNVCIRVTDGANLLWSVCNATAIPASTTVTVSYISSSIASAVLGAPGAMAVPAPIMWMPAGYVVSSSTPAIDVADQYSAIVLWFECLDFGQYGIPELAHDPTVEEQERIPPRYDVEV